MELGEVMRTTPATREFAPEPLPDEVLHRILDHARFAPSGGNRQAWTVVVVRDRATRVRLRELYQLGWREYVAHAPLGQVPFAPQDEGRWTGPAVDLELARRTPHAPHPFADHLEDVPALLVVCARLDLVASVDNGLDRQPFMGGASVYPFTHNILLKARDEGYGGVITTVVARQEPAVRALLGIPPGVAVAALVALGRPARSVTRLRRRPVEEFTVVDRFDGRPFLVPDHR
ncbi:MAG: nitroreductase family protein [Acidimicrobiia bacterium]